MLTVRGVLLKLIGALLAVICLTGFSPYTSVTITISKFESGCHELEAARDLLRNLGYQDAKVSNPTRTKSGFRSSNPKGIFVILDCNVSSSDIELSFSQYSNHFTDSALEQLDRLIVNLRERFKDKAVTVNIANRSFSNET